MKDGQKASEREKKTREKQPFRNPCNKRQSEGRETETERESEIMKRPERGQRLPGTVEFMLDLSLFMEQLAVNGKME